MDSPANAMNHFLKYYSYIFNILLVSTYVGIGITAPSWMTTVDYYLKIFISIFLIYRFNSFRTMVFEELDRRVAFSAGVIIFTSTIVNKVLLSYSTKYRDEIMDSIGTKINKSINK